MPLSSTIRLKRQSSMNPVMQCSKNQRYTFNNVVICVCVSFIFAMTFFFIHCICEFVWCELVRLTRKVKIPLLYIVCVNLAQSGHTRILYRAYCSSSVYWLLSATLVRFFVCSSCDISQNKRKCFLSIFLVFYYRIQRCTGCLYLYA